jgi:PilZ domain-containing protein
MSPHVVPPGRDRRKTTRVCLEPLRVRLDRTREGIVVDLSEGGALLQMSTSPPQDRGIAVEIEWKNISVALHARVVRAVPRHVRLESATLERMEYCVALEFLGMTHETSAAVRRIIQSH